MLSFLGLFKMLSFFRVFKTLEDSWESDPQKSIFDKTSRCLEMWLNMPIYILESVKTKPKEKWRIIRAKIYASQDQKSSNTVAVLIHCV